MGNDDHIFQHNDCMQNSVSNGLVYKCDIIRNIFESAGYFVELLSIYAIVYMSVKEFKKDLHLVHIYVMNIVPINYLG